MLVLVLLGMGVVGVGGYLMWKRRAGGQAGGATVAVDSSVDAWCDLRREWDKRALALAGDIMLAAATPGQESRRDELNVERNKTCQERARSLRELLARDARLRKRVEPVEQALEAESKARTDLAVAIHNLGVDASDATMAGLEAIRKELLESIPKRIRAARASADAAFSAAIAGLPCKGIYRGPRTDEGTADNPYVTWAELELQRALVLKRVEDRIAALEPEQRLQRRVHARLLGRYRRDLKGCYGKARRASAATPARISLHLRLSRAGKVRRLGVEPAGQDAERVLDCLLEKVGAWRLPPPAEDMHLVVVKVDFTAL